GLPTTGDADPQAVARRLLALGEGAGIACHAVATAAAHDAVTLDALARIGGGSSRVFDGDAAETALALLTDALGPSLKDVRIEIDGVETARVYPELLTNVPVGQQRLVLGRFLPADAERSAELVVSGTLRGERVEWRREVRFPARDADGVAEASFLPRLWASRHVEALMQELPSPAVREEIVARSAEFGII